MAHLLRVLHVHFQYLVFENKLGTNLTWVPNGQPSAIPHGAVLGGHDGDGSPFYIIRADSRVGWYDPRETRAVYGIHGDPTSSLITRWEFLILTYCEYKVLQLILDYVCVDETSGP